MSLQLYRCCHFPPARVLTMSTFLLCGVECWITFFSQVVTVIKELNTWHRDGNCRFSQRDELAEMKGLRREPVTWTVSYRQRLLYGAHPARHFPRFPPYVSSILLSPSSALFFCFCSFPAARTRYYTFSLRFPSQMFGYIYQKTHFRLHPANTIMNDRSCSSHTEKYEMPLYNYFQLHWKYMCPQSPLGVLKNFGAQTNWASHMRFAADYSETLEVYVYRSATLSLCFPIRFFFGLHGFNPRAIYTDRSTATCRRS
jgi:hypothetical protein